MPLNREIQTYANNLVMANVRNDPPTYYESRRVMELLQRRFPKVQRATLSCAFGRAMGERRKNTLQLLKKVV